MSTYKPKTVAVATVRGVPNVRVTRGDGIFANKWYSNRPVTGSLTSFSNAEVTNIRPLVVLDLYRPDLIGEFVECARGDGWSIEPGSPLDVLGEQLERQIAAQTKPPKPAEPGKYGVVLAGDGREWFRYTTSERSGRDWCRPGTDGGTEYARWGDLEVLDIKREGVQP